MAPLLRDLAQAYAAIKALDLRLAPVLGEARHDMVMHQRPGAAGASKEVFAGKLGPHHTFRYGHRKAFWECDEQSLPPQRFRIVRRQILDPVREIVTDCHSGVVTAQFATKSPVTHKLVRQLSSSSELRHDRRFCGPQPAGVGKG